MTDWTREKVAALVRRLYREPFYTSSGECADLPEEAATALAAMSAERDKMVEAVKEVSLVEKQIRFSAYASAGDAARIGDVKMFALWAGSLQHALSALPLPTHGDRRGRNVASPTEPPFVQRD